MPIPLSFLSPDEIADQVADRARARRLQLGFTQQGLAERAGMSVSSLKRFERTGQIAFASLVRVAVVLDAVEAFAALFEPPSDETLDDVLADADRKRGWRR